MVTKIPFPKKQQTGSIETLFDERFLRITHKTRWWDKNCLYLTFAWSRFQLWLHPRLKPKKQPGAYVRWSASIPPVRLTSPWAPIHCRAINSPRWAGWESQQQRRKLRPASQISSASAAAFEWAGRRDVSLLISHDIPSDELSGNKHLKRSRCFSTDCRDVLQPPRIAVI